MPHEPPAERLQRRCLWLSLSMSMLTKLIVLGLFVPYSSAFVASSPTRSPWLQHHGGPRPRALPSMADSSEVAAKRLLLEAAFAKGELKEANKRLKILLMQTTAAKGVVAGVVAVTASAVAAPAGSGVVLGLMGRAVLIAAGAAAGAGVAEAIVEFILCLINSCLEPDRVEGDSSEALVINSCDLTLWTVVIISAWRTQARRLPSAYMDALKAQLEAHPPGLPSLADQSEGGRLEAVAKRQALETASTEEGLAENSATTLRARFAKIFIGIKRGLIFFGAMVGYVVGQVVVDVQMLAAMASAVGAQAAVSKAVGWAVAVATVGTTGLVAGARAAEFFDFPFQNLLRMDDEEQVRSSPPNYRLPSCRPTTICNAAVSHTATLSCLCLYRVILFRRCVDSTCTRRASGKSASAQSSTSSASSSATSHSSDHGTLALRSWRAWRSFRQCSMLQTLPHLCVRLTHEWTSDTLDKVYLFLATRIGVEAGGLAQYQVGCGTLMVSCPWRVGPVYTILPAGAWLISEVRSHQDQRQEAR